MAYQFKEYKLQRTGEPPVMFAGRLVSSGSSRDHEDNFNPNAWHVVKIFETKSGKWIGYVWFHSGKNAVADEYTVSVHDSKAFVLNGLAVYGHRDSKSFQIALGQALDHETFIEHVD